MKEIKEEITEILSDHYREDWMSEEDFEEFKEMLLDSIGGWDTLLQAVEEGKEKGYSVASQMELLRKAFPSARKD